MILIGYTTIALGQVSDRLAGDGTETYVNIEFSADNKYAILMEAKEISGKIKYRTFLSQVDSKGNLIPRSGKQHLIGETPMLGMPQWGEDKTGPYAVMLSIHGNLMSIRPNGSRKPSIKLFRDNASKSIKALRAFPYPSFNKSSTKQFVTYQIRNNNSGKFQQMMVELTQKNPKHTLVYQENYINGRVPGPIVSFARWLKNSFDLYYGAYSVDCNHPNSKICPAQVKKLTVSNGKITDHRYVTTDRNHKIDAFPFSKDGKEIKLFAGLNLSKDGGVYLYNSRSKQFKLQAEMILDQNQSDLKQPGSAQSMEPFLWGNDLYVSYQVVDNGIGIKSHTASSYPGEIWIYNSKTGSTCKVSKDDHPYNPYHKNKRARVDAEPILSNRGSQASLYYHSAIRRDSDDLVFDLRKIDLGSRSKFNHACQ